MNNNEGLCVFRAFNFFVIFALLSKKNIGTNKYKAMLFTA